MGIPAKLRPVDFKSNDTSYMRNVTADQREFTREWETEWGRVGFHLSAK